MNFDRTGYPDVDLEWGQATLSRIVAVADVFDALTSDRVYRKAWAPDAVLANIRDNAGIYFDPALASLCAQPLVWQAFLAVRGV
jgi:putative two-component system response regulator